MKKTISILVLFSMLAAAMLALFSCGGVSLKSYSKDDVVTAEEFEDELFDKLGEDNESFYKTDWEAEYKSEAKTTTKTVYDSGKTLKSSEKAEEKMEIKYDDDNRTAYVKEYEYSKGSGNDWEEMEKSEDEYYYAQKGDDLYTFYPDKKMYNNTDKEDGVYSTVYSDLYSLISGIVGSDYVNSMSYEKLEYYISGSKNNVYTIYKEDENIDYDDEDNTRTKTTKIETTQIVVEDEKITFITQSEYTVEYEGQDYTRTTEVKGTTTMTLTFGDVDVKEQSTVDYTKYAD